MGQRQHTTARRVAGPWSLATSRAFWEGFGPARLRDQGSAGLRTTFRVEADWSRAAVTVRRRGSTAVITVTGDGDLDAAARQTARFLSLDVDAREWPAVGARDPVIESAQRELPGLRPCGFHSPYEAGVWAVLSQRLRIAQAAGLRDRLMTDAVLPAPEQLRTARLDLPGRKAEFLRAVADAALDGVLDGDRLRAIDPASAVQQVRQVKGLGPFGAELVVLRGAGHPDALARNEPRLAAEIARRYGPGARPEEVSEAWRPFRTWAAVHLRVLAERRTLKIGGEAAMAETG